MTRSVQGAAPWLRPMARARMACNIVLVYDKGGSVCKGPGDPPGCLRGRAYTGSLCRAEEREAAQQPDSGELPLPDSDHAPYLVPN